MKTETDGETGGEQEGGDRGERVAGVGMWGRGRRVGAGLGRRQGELEGLHLLGSALDSEGARSPGKPGCPKLAC